MSAVDHQPFSPHKELYEEKMAIARKKIARYPGLLELFEDLDADYQKRPTSSLLGKPRYCVY